MRLLPYLPVLTTKPYDRIFPIGFHDFGAFSRVFGSFCLKFDGFCSILSGFHDRITTRLQHCVRRLGSVQGTLGNYVAAPRLSALLQSLVLCTYSNNIGLEFTL